MNATGDPIIHLRPLPSALMGGLYVPATNDEPALIILDATIAPDDQDAVLTGLQGVRRNRKADLLLLAS